MATVQKFQKFLFERSFDAEPLRPVEETPPDDDEAVEEVEAPPTFTEDELESARAVKDSRAAARRRCANPWTRRKSVRRCAQRHRRAPVGSVPHPRASQRGNGPRRHRGRGGDRAQAVSRPRPPQPTGRGGGDRADVDGADDGRAANRGPRERRVDGRLVGEDRGAAFRNRLRGRARRRRRSESSGWRLSDRMERRWRRARHQRALAGN